LRSPRARYRAACLLLAVALALAVVAALNSMWLLVAAMLVVALGAMLTRRDLRRRGVDWDGPASYRELRER
jgi:predicted branched-subunit amino acid permease